MNLVAGKYVDDRGSEWQMLVGEEYFNQAGLGWAAADPTDPMLKTIDKSFKPRVVLVRSSQGETRRIVCATKTATAYMGSASSIDTSKNDDATLYTSTVYGYEGERRRFIRPAAPTQGA